MLRAKVIFNKEPKNTLESVRSFFDSYASVSLLLNNKVYQVSFNGQVSVVSYEYIKHKGDVSYDILVPNAYVYTKAEKFLQRQLGKPFDYFGATFGQILGLGFQDRNKWHDAELVGRFLQYCLFDEVMEYNTSKMTLKELELRCKDIVVNQTSRKQAILAKGAATRTLIEN